MHSSGIFVQVCYCHESVILCVCVCVCVQLHSRCESVVARDVPEVLHALRVLAKFLGYLDFLPYSSVLSPAFLPTRTASVRNQCALTVALCV